MKGEVLHLNAKDAWNFLKDKHYAGRKPQISKAFGWLIDDELVAVCTFGKPASPSLCKGICGVKHSSSVYELNRLCRIESLNEQLSQFVSACLRIISELNWIVVSYSDTSMHHNGYIYIKRVIFFSQEERNKELINTQKVVSIADIMTMKNKVHTEL